MHRPRTVSTASRHGRRGQTEENDMSYPSTPGPYDALGAYGSYPAVHTHVVTQPYRSSTAHIVIAWIVAVCTLGYMLPWAIAATRNKSNTAVVALINFLLGWSLVGWIVALVMSLTSEPHPVVYVNTAVIPPPQPPYGHLAAQTPMLQQPPPQQQPFYGADQGSYGHQPSEPTAILPPVEEPNCWPGSTYR
jgi:hypothetical protein